MVNSLWSRNITNKCECN